MMIDSPFMQSLREREAAARRVEWLRMWAVLATAAAVTGWLGFAIIVLTWGMR